MVESTGPEGVHSGESLPLRGLHALAPWAWRFMVVTVVFLAVYVAAGRYLMQQVPVLRDPLVEFLNERLPFRIEVLQLTGGWSAFSPEVHFNGLELSFPDAELKPVVLERGSLRLDVPASLGSRTVQFSRLEVAGLSLDARLNTDGSIEIIGFEGGDGAALRAWLESFLPNVERVALTDNRLAVDTGAEPLVLDLNLLLERLGNTRSLQGSVQGDNIILAIHAEGVGNPLKPLSWSGDLYVDARSGDLAALSKLWDSMDWPFTLTGAAGAQFWLNRSEGDSRARVSLTSAGLQLDERGGAWSLPLDALSFEADLAQRARHWTLLTEDFHIERLGQSLDLDRAQFDWWGQALRIRASDLSLEALPSLLTAAPGIPQGLRDALPELAPGGQLRSVELRLDDLAAPAGSWSVRARLDDLTIDSWSLRRTPALSGVSGYLTLDSGGGELQLDADAFSMHYPTVYKTPLVYDEARGSIYLSWDSGHLKIDSGLMSLRGDEGRASGVFAVDIPFTERVTGVELDLLIGLVDSHVRHRDKYLPYTLPPALGEWLGRSIQAGAIDTAGFVWRGSTRKGSAPYRTLQLFVDVRDATLAYDPAWPALESMDAMVWVDDDRTFARADDARTAGATVRDAMVRVWSDGGQIRLDVEGAISGDAGVARTLFAETPLRDVTDGVFADWSFAGPLSGNLRVTQLLGAPAALPTIDLAVDLQGVDAGIKQLDLHLDDVQGPLRYRSGAGFAGSSVTGSTLGGTFAAVAGEGPLPELELTLTGDVDAIAVAEWLQLPQMKFARGVTALTGSLTLDETAGAWLRLESELQGISLDAPRPFQKAPDQPLPLSVAVPLRAAPALELALGERLRVDLQLADDGVEQLVAAVGGGEPDADRCDQRYCLAGAVSSLDLVEWREFYARYFDAVAVATPPIEDPGAYDAMGVPYPAQLISQEPVQPFSYRIDSLDVGELQLGERSLGSARVDLWGVDNLWQGAAEAAWLQGSLTREDAELQLLLEHLDVDRFSGGEPTALMDFRDLLPSMRVDILELRDGERLLGGLGFDLDTGRSADSLYATGITGQLWNLTLDDPQPGMLRWASIDGQERTTLEIDAVFDDFTDVLTAAEFEPTMESESGSATLRLSWPGGPTAFEAASASGSVALAAANGRILESRPGALGLISLLNFAEILRGLSLAHMFEAGIPFLTASTELYLHQGTLEIVDLHIDGAASAFAFTGLSNLTEGSIDGELVVTLPVANNLPWVAALAAGLPVAAGVFVVSKVFEKQVNRMSSAVYGVSGEMAAPDVEFRRLFDDSVSPAPAGPGGSGTGGG